LYNNPVINNRQAFKGAILSDIEKFREVTKDLDIVEIKNKEMLTDEDKELIKAATIPLNFLMSNTPFITTISDRFTLAFFHDDKNSKREEERIVAEIEGLSDNTKKIFKILPDMTKVEFEAIKTVEDINRLWPERKES